MILTEKEVRLTCTGGPRYSRTFHLRFRLFPVHENIPKFTVRGLSLAHSWSIEEFGLKNDIKWLFFWHTVCSLVIRGFSIRGNLMKHIYCELRGKPVCQSSSFVNLHSMWHRKYVTGMEYPVLLKLDCHLFVSKIPFQSVERKEKL
jgi:hypothetical protein